MQLGGGATHTRPQVWVLLVALLGCSFLVQQAAAQQCGLSICYVLDASTSINSVLGASNNPPTTFQNQVKKFMKDLTASIQTIANGNAEFGGAYFGAYSASFPGLSGLTSNLATFNASIDNTPCPVPVGSTCGTGGTSTCNCGHTQCKNSGGGNLGCITGSAMTASPTANLPSGGETQFTNSDSGIWRCDDGAGGGILSLATKANKLVLFITDGVPNRKRQVSEPASGTGLTTFDGIPTNTSKAGTLNWICDAGAGGQGCSSPNPPEAFCTSDTGTGGNPISECAAEAAGRRARGIRQRGISFISVGIGSTSGVNEVYLDAISTDYFRVDGFGSLTASIEAILRKVCTDVSLQKTVSATNVTIGGNVTYTLSVSNVGAYVTGEPPRLNDSITAGMTILLPVQPVNGPAPNCDTVGSSGTGMTLRCNWTSTMPVGATWTIRYTARADTPGAKTNVATLINVDAIENNQQSTVNISITTSCGSPFGNATRLTCPVNTIPIGNDSLPLSGVASFAATCCRSADVAITKSVSPASATVGSTLAFTVGLTNRGPQAAPSPIVFTDTLPAGLQYVGPVSGSPAAVCTNTTGAGSTTVLNCTVNSEMANGASWSYSYAVRAVAVGALTNQVSLPRTDANVTNNNASATATVLGTCANPFGNGTLLFCSPGRQYNASTASNTITGPGQFDAVCCSTTPDVAVTKDVSSSSAAVGSVLTYTIRLINTGSVPSPAANNFTDTLPAGLTYLGPVNSVGSPAAACSTSPSGTSTVLGCSINSVLPAGTTWTYTYTARVDTPGPKVNTVQLTRVDNNTANNVDVKTVTVLGTCASPFGNGTTLSCPGGTSINSTAANNTITGPGQFGTVCCGAVDVAVAKSVSPASAAVGSTLTFTVALTNRGPQAAPSPIVFTDTLPAGLQYVGPVSGSPAAVCTNTTGAGGTTVLSCTVNTEMTTGASWSYSYPVRAVSVGAQTNQVSLPRTDANVTNNNASATATVLGTCANPFGNGTKLTCPATKSYTGPDGRNISSSSVFGTVCCTVFDVLIDVKVNGSDTGVSGPTGSTLDYRVTLSSTPGGVNSTGNGFTITLPPGVFVTGDITAGPGSPPVTCTRTGTNGVDLVIACESPAVLVPGQDWTYTISTTATTPGDKTVNATLTKPDSNTANNQDSVPVTLWNLCGNPFGNGTRGSCAPLEYVGPDSRPIYANSTFAATCCSGFDVAINITASPGSALVGNTFTYTINITNVGSTVSTGLNGFIVQVPADVTVVNPGTLVPGPGTPPAVCTPSSGQNGTTLVCSVAANLAVGATWVYTFNATSNQVGDYKAVASLTKPDSNPTNDRDDAPINLFALFDVAATITLPDQSLVVGSTFTYTVNISNVGGTTSPGNNSFIIQVPADVTVPPGTTLTPQGGDTPAAICKRVDLPSGATVLNCTVISDLPAGTIWVYTFDAVGNKPGDYTADVSLTKPDMNPDNDKDDAPINLFPLRDVAVNITATPGSALVGSNFTYTVNLTNVGGSMSTGDNGFIVTLPPGVTLPPNAVLTPGPGSPPATCTPSAGGTVQTCSIGANMTVGDSWAYTFPATGGATPGDYVANVTLNQPDMNPANDRDDAPINLFAVKDVAVNITATPGSALVGSDFTYTVNLTNVGASVSPGDNGFTVELPPGVSLPPGAALQPVGTSPGVNCTVTQDGGKTVLACKITEDFPVGDSWAYTFLATGGATPGDYVANVTLNQPDMNPANDRDDAPINLFAVKDVAVNITATPPSGDVGTSFNYTVNITNVGAVPSPGDNGFTIQLPHGVVVTHPGQLVPVGPDTPPAVCVPSGTNGVDLVLRCTVNETLPSNTTWIYEFQAVGTTPGDKDASVQLNQPDNNPANDQDNTIVNFILTCVNPFGNGTRPPCPPETSFTGPPEKQIAMSTDFAVQCCSVVDRALKLEVTPPVGPINNPNITLTIELSNPGNRTSPGEDNTFEIRVPPGLTPTGQITPVGPGTPPLECVETGGNGAETVFTCRVPVDLLPNTTWTFELPLSGGSTPGDYPITGTTTTPDGNPPNNADGVTVSLEATCANPNGSGPRPDCPPGSLFTGPSNKTLSSSSDFAAACCGLVDRALNLEINQPSSPVNNPNLTLTIKFSNPGNTTSPAGDNTFEILLPPGLTPTGPITPGPGSPPVNCTSAPAPNGGILFMCTVPEDLPPGTNWPFELPLSGGPNPGDFPISGTTTTPDSNPPNNADNVVVKLVATCINPLGTGSLLTCPPGQAFVGPNEKPINSTDTFVQQCCDVIDVGITKTASPASVLVGSLVNYTVTLSNVGPTASPAPNGFTDLLPANLAFVGPVKGSLGAPAVTCNTTGDQTVGTVMQCATNTPMPAAAFWTYTYAARTIAPGSFTNQAQVLYADSNPNNDKSPAPVTVKSTCDNPTGSGTRPPCPPGSVYMGPDTAVLDNPTAFDNLCCVGENTLPMLLEVTTPPCRAHPVGSPVNVTFTVTNTGERTIAEVAVAFNIFDKRANYTGIQVTDPSGALTELYNTGVCSDDDDGDDTVFFGCALFDFIPRAQAVFTLMFQPTGVVDTPVLATVFFGNKQDIEEQTEAINCLKTLECPPYQAVVGTSCQSATCNPCAETNPTVYLSTGSQAKPANGLWQIRNFAVGRMDLVPEFLCVIDGVDGQIGDIAVLHKGDIVVLDTGGNLRYIPVRNLPTTPTTDYTRRCPTIPLFKFSGSYSGYTGLSTGFRSDMLIATTGNGWVVPLLLTPNGAQEGGIAAGPLPGTSAEQPIYWGCWYSGASSSAGVTNTGGTDITPGPDGQYYRWCSKDGNMEYTGTRFMTRFADGYYQLNGNTGSFVSNRLSDQGSGGAPFSNAGAFCTRTAVVGTGAFVRPVVNGQPAESGAYAQFYAYGFNNAQMRGFGLSIFATTTGVRSVAAAQLTGRTVVIANPDGTPRTDALRVNGAAVKPQCQF